MPDETGRKQGNGRFRPGLSGNPSGRPRGVRNKASVLLEQIGEDAAEALLKKVISKARHGDMRAAEIVLRRIWPEPRGRKVTFKMLPIKSAADAPRAIAAIISAIGEGVLTPTEGQECAKLVADYVVCLRVHRFEQRLDALDKAAAEIDGNQVDGHGKAF